MGFTFRLVKGSALTFVEADNNFQTAAYQVPVWNANYQYGIGNFTTISNNIYRSLTSNLNKNPTTNALDWQLWVPAHTHDIYGIAPAVIDENDMHSNSALKVPTQRSVKAYVDTYAGLAYNDTKAINAVAGALLNNVFFTWNYNPTTKKINGIINNTAISAANLSVTGTPTTGQVLSYDSTLTNGLRWISAANPFKLIVEAATNPALYTPPQVKSEVCIGIGNAVLIDPGNSGCFAWGDQAQILAGSSSSTNCTVVGGSQSSIVGSTNSSVFGSIDTAVGQTNTRTVVVGGQNNVTAASLTEAAMFASSDSTVSASQGTVIAGHHAEAAATNSTVIGSYAKSSIPLSLVIGSDAFSSGVGPSKIPGTSQEMLITSMMAVTTDATTASLQLNGTDLSVDSKSVWTFTIQVSAIQVDGTSGTHGDAGSFVITGAVKNVGGSASFLGTAAVTSYLDAGASAWTAGVSVTGTNLEVRVTGEANKTIRWSASLRLTSLGAFDVL